MCCVSLAMCLLHRPVVSYAVVWHQTLLLLLMEIECTMEKTDQCMQQEDDQVERPRRERRKRPSLKDVARILEAIKLDLCDPITKVQAHIDLNAPAQPLICLAAP